MAPHAVILTLVAALAVTYALLQGLGAPEALPAIAIEGLVQNGPSLPAPPVIGVGSKELERHTNKGETASGVSLDFAPDRATCSNDKDSTGYTGVSAFFPPVIVITDCNDVISSICAAADKQIHSPDRRTVSLTHTAGTCAGTILFTAETVSADWT